MSDKDKNENARLERNRKGQIEPGSVLNPRGNRESLRPRRSQASFRDAIRKRVGDDGGKLWDTLADIAEGKPWCAEIQLPNGQIARSEPQIPTTSDRRHAAVALGEFLFGKAVPQTEVLKAEEAAQELAEVRALTDEELHAKVRAIYAGRSLPLGLLAEEGQVPELAGVPEPDDT